MRTGSSTAPDVEDGQDSFWMWQSVTSALFQRKTATVPWEAAAPFSTPGPVSPVSSRRAMLTSELEPWLECFSSSEESPSMTEG
ncbi:hypothetical protein ACFV2V_18015 [Streptomyces sp. NPDC059698]|uniref:hypothetical protein n=1 Tax=unclassified Streptomyces TaxID=2593676 RepID=UPI001160F7E7|nr:hypothetical protein [Streptomyces sp. CB02366]